MKTETNIEIKFNLCDSLWAMVDNKPKQIIIKSFKVECTYAGYSADKWGQTTNGGGGYPIKIFYNEDGYGGSNSTWVSESSLFKTKEELLKSL